MHKLDADIENQNKEFAEIALKSLQEGVRRALVEHEQHGLLVPDLSNSEIEWVSPGAKLSLYPKPRKTRDTTQ